MQTTSPTMSQRTSPPTSTGNGKTTAMATTLRCRPWRRCTTGLWRCISIAQVLLWWVGERLTAPGLSLPCPAHCGCYFLLFSAEPINTFHGIHQNEDEPIRVSYHRNIHYNSVVNPNKATIGVGLGLPSFKPGVSMSPCPRWLLDLEARNLCLGLSFILAHKNVLSPL